MDERLIRSIQLRAFSTPVTAIIVFLLSFFLASGANMAWVLIWVFQSLIIRHYQAPAD